MAITINVDWMPADKAKELECTRRPVYLERRGKRIGIVVPMEEYSDWEQRGLDLLAEIQKATPESALIPEEEVDADIERAIREVRMAKP